MTRANNVALLSIVLLAAAACGNDSKTQPAAGSDTQTMAETADKTGDGDLNGAVVTPGAPYKLDYEIIGTPVVGSPVAIELSIASLHGAQGVQLDYGFKDPSALVLAESQPASIKLDARRADDDPQRQRISIIPQREGRFYLNVSASFETTDGTVSTIVAIPIQVGNGTRELTPNGELETDENGEAIRVLSEE